MLRGGNSSTVTSGQTAKLSRSGARTGAWWGFGGARGGGVRTAEWGGGQRGREGRRRAQQIFSYSRLPAEEEDGSRGVISRGDRSGEAPERAEVRYSSERVCP